MLFKKMVLFAIIAIFDHYYKFCDVFKMIFERKTIRNVPKRNVLVKIRNFIPKLPVSLACKSSTGSQGQGKKRETTWLQNYFSIL